jgi:hypothetical protein
MMSARQVYDISERAWDVMRKLLPFPSNRLLRDAFRESRSAICHALLDTEEIATNPSFSSGISVVLAVDAAAFRPLITVHENGTIDGLNQINDIDTDLFDKLMGQSQAFGTIDGLNQISDIESIRGFLPFRYNRLIRDFTVALTEMLLVKLCRDFLTEGTCYRLSRRRRRLQFQCDASKLFSDMDSEHERSH